MLASPRRANSSRRNLCASRSRLRHPACRRYSECEWQNSSEAPCAASASNGRFPPFYVKGIELAAEAPVDETAESRLVCSVHPLWSKHLNRILLAVAPVDRARRQSRQTQEKLLRPVFSISRRNTISNPLSYPVRHIGWESQVELAEVVRDDEPIVTHEVT
jgi:hypothetical protein